MKKYLLSLLITSFAFMNIDAMNNNDSVKKSIYNDADLFTDLSFSSLKDGVKKKEIAKIENPQLAVVAKALYDGTYDKEYRVAEYHAVKTPELVAKQLLTGGTFTRYENITGMVLHKGENIVLVGDTHDKKITLLAPNFMRKPAPEVKVPTEDPMGWGLYYEEYELDEGVNVINLPRESNVYIGYYEDEPEKAPAITVHFLTGDVNGYFDIDGEFTNERFNELLDNAKSEILDMRGRFIQMAYPVKWLKQFTYGKGVELTQNYDKMLGAEYEILGFEKYNRLPKNHILARVNHNYYMFRDGDGVAFYGDEGTMRMVLVPESVIGETSWGFCHEIGHALQPSAITWSGMTEVSNNILANYASIKVGNESGLIRCGSHEMAEADLLNKGVSYMEIPDLFTRLVPFWQLELYFEKAGIPDGYKDIFETFRTSDKPVDQQSIETQFNFIKTVCDVTKTDFTDFFESYGFFKTGTLKIDDYTPATYVITEEMVQEVKEYIKSKNYPKPSIDPTTLK